MNKKSLRKDAMNLQGHYIKRINGNPLSADIGPAMFASNIRYGFPIFYIDGINGENLCSGLNTGLQFEITHKDYYDSKMEKWNSFRLEENRGKCVRELDDQPKRKIKTLQDLQVSWYSMSQKFPDKKFVAYKCECGFFHIGKDKRD